MATKKPTMPATIEALGLIVTEAVRLVSEYNKRNPEYPVNEAQVGAFLEQAIDPARVNALVSGLKADIMALVMRGKGPIRWDPSFLA